MPLQTDMKLISVDDHLMEPPSLWVERLPSKYRDVCPRVLEDADGTQFWMFEDREYRQFLAMIGVVDGFDPEDYDIEAVVRYDQMARGVYIPDDRVKAMDRAGVDVELCFPSIPRFAGTLFLSATDKTLALACVQAWNDYVLDEWCATAPDRFIPCMIIPLWDAELAATEVRRTAVKGARTITFPENPAPLGMPSLHTRYWDPVFAACEEAGMPLSVHIGTSGVHTNTSEDASEAEHIMLICCNSMGASLDFVLSGIFQRFPGLKVALSEGGIGWLPYTIERARFVWERHRHWNDIPQIDPVEIFRDHIYGCFIDDVAGLTLRHTIGVDNIMWEQDYPHADTIYPRSRARATEMLADVPDDEAHKIAELNARKLYRFPA